MPPKAERGATSRGRPRGRGRGRGRGIAIEAIETPELRGVPEEPSQPSQSPAPIAPIAPMAPMTQSTGTITPKVEPSDDAFDPNTSPAMIPAETPAQTPVTVPAKPPAESATIRGRGGATMRARGESTGRARFKPKNIRRDQADRERLEQEERDRKAANQAQAEKEARRSQRGRGHTGRGRGDAMGQNRGAGRGAPMSSATGIFSVAPAAMDRKGGMDGFAIGNTRGGGGGGGGGGGFGGGGGGGGGGSGSGNGGGVNVLSAENSSTFDPEYPDEGDGQVRKVNIEMISLVEDDDDDMVGSGRGGKGGYKSRSLAPIRIKREEHKERSNMMVSDSDLAEAAKKQVDEAEGNKSGEDVEMTMDGAATAEDPRTKDEPGLESPTMLKFPEFKAPSSPEEKKRLKKEVDSPQQSKVLRPSRKKDKVPVIQTEEDKFEYERYLEDVDILAEELRLLRGNVDKTPKDRGKGKAVDVDGDVGMDGEQEQDESQPEANHADGRIYLFQFPPVLPRLFNPQVENSEDVVVTQSSEQIDLTDDKDKGIKKESEEVIIKTEPNVAQENEALVGEQGYIGKLVVRKSGKVELDWGGTSMAVGRGVPAAFLSQIVLAEDPKGEAPEGVATGLGKVMGKFIVTPDWEKIF
ncbi:hypothetical protein OCU04_003088 [Sclerotinia nivalis]|uniref:DNA-directed RNA polymerase III RPC4 n=1 Tax=Sclerotinia nivalis TaxID=352851 RepID=A0A9X0AUZ3_9HELO|nr:hypothetical protein OCU04_003088 [Sclerotinia nivalis]